MMCRIAHMLQVTETPGQEVSVLQKSNSSARRNSRSSSVTEGQIMIILFALDCDLSKYVK